LRGLFIVLEDRLWRITRSRRGAPVFFYRVVLNGGKGLAKRGIRLESLDFEQPPSQRDSNGVSSVISAKLVHNILDVEVDGGLGNR
jgi:hypothetical protein